MDETIAKDNWSEDQIRGIENGLLKGIQGVRTYEAVESAITYAAFLNTVGLTPENYPVFLKMLEIVGGQPLQLLHAHRCRLILAAES